MKAEEIKTIKIEFEGDESDRFKSAIKKINEQENKAGFNNSTLTADEKTLIRDIDAKVN